MNPHSQQQLNTKLFKPPSAVIYSRDFEPISHVPMNDTIYGYFTNYDIVRFPVQIPFNYDMPEIVNTTTLYAEIKGMKVFSSDGIRLILIAVNDDTALLMNNTFLPGQTKEVNFIKTKAFFEGMVKAMKEKK